MMKITAALFSALLLPGEVKAAPLLSKKRESEESQPKNQTEQQPARVVLHTHTAEPERKGAGDGVELCSERHAPPRRRVGAETGGPATYGAVWYRPRGQQDRACECMMRVAERTTAAQLHGMDGMVCLLKERKQTGEQESPPLDPVRRVFSWCRCAVGVVCVLVTLRGSNKTVSARCCRSKPSNEHSVRLPPPPAAGRKLR